MLIDDLKRNDVDGAVAAYRECALELDNDAFYDAVHELIMLQDDPAELERRLEEVNQEPAIVAALEEIGPVTTPT